MLQFFRSAVKSRIGAAVAIAVLVLIALAFASGDVSNTGGFGGVAGGDRVATVGGERIDNATLSQAATSALERVKEDDPTISMKAFLANGGLEDVLSNLIDRMAIAVFGEKNGIVASDRLIDSEIGQMPAFRGADGKFSDDVFRQMMQQRGISEKLLRDDLRQGLIARQVMVPAGIGVRMPNSLATRYASLLNETRKGEIAVLPSVLFAEKEEPSDEQIAAYYKKHQNDFIRPERRVIRYASFGEEILKDIPKPSDAEIAFRFKANKERYAASEKRRITQLVVPTEAAAKVVMDEVAGGKSLEESAKAKGLAASSLEFFSKEELERQFSKGVADAVFATQRRKIAPPARSALGWHVVRVEEIDSRPARTLDQVRDELAKEITVEKRRVALTEALERIEDDFDAGGNLSEAAESLGLEIKTTPPVTADGNIYLKRGETVPDVLKPALGTAFTMEMEEPQLAEVERGKTFLIYDVTDIAPSAPAPLAEIKTNVKTAYIVDKASAAAKKAAEAVRAELGKGKTLQQALESLKRRLPPVQTISMTRPELSQMQRQRGQVPAPLALMFNMAEGTAKVQPGPAKQAWFVVVLNDIVPGKVADDDKIIATAQRELSLVARSEYTDALGRAIRKDMGVERNSDGIRAVREKLGGGD